MEELLVGVVGTSYCYRAPPGLGRNALISLVDLPLFNLKKLKRGTSRRPCPWVHGSFVLIKLGQALVDGPNF